MSVKITSTGGISALGGLSSTQVNNYFACNVGIGINKPAYALTIDNGDLLVCTDNGGYFQVDESACAVKHSDCVKAMFGTGNDLQIYHDGNNKIEGSSGYTRVAATNGVLYLDGNNTCIRSGDGGETQAKFLDNGAVELYYDNSKKFETTDDGIKATGAICGTGNLDIDGHSTLMGNLSVRGTVTCIDTRIETTSAIEVQNAGTGPAILANQLGSQPVVDFQDDGTSAFYIEDGGNVGIGCTNPTEKLEVAGNIIAKDGGVLAGLGSGKDGFIFHDLYSGSCYWGYKAFTGGNSRLSISTDTQERLTVNANGCVGIGTTTPNEKLTVQGKISASSCLLLPDAGQIRIGTGEQFRIYHSTNNCIESQGGDIIFYNYDHGNNITFCAENSSGTAGNYIQINSSTNCTIFGKNTRHSDNVSAYFGCGGDLQIFNDSADSIIKENSRHLCIQNAATDGDIIFAADCGDGCATTPYFAVDGGFGGICYFKSTLHADGVQAGFGTGNDMQIQHNGANGFINNACGTLNICSADDVLIDAESDINLDANGADIRFKDDGTIIGAFQNSSSNFVIKSGQDDKDIIFCGSDDGVDINALTLDMSNAGKACFNSTACFGGTVCIQTGAPSICLIDSTDDDDHSIRFANNSGTVDYEIRTTDPTSGGGGDGLYIGSCQSDGEVVIFTNDTHALTLAANQKATFADEVCMGNSKLVLNGTAVNSTAAELNLLDGCTSACGIDCTGTTTASNSQTFTNKSGCISQWTNDCGYLTSESCCGTVTCVGTGDGLTGGAITLTLLIFQIPELFILM